MPTVGARIRVKKWKVDNRKISRVLANDPAIQGALKGYASKVVVKAEARIAAVTITPRGAKSPLYLGHHWALSPRAVVGNSKTGQKNIKLKPGAEVAVFRTKGGGAVGGVIPVVLIVADHPASRLYEFGLDGFPQVGMLSGAITAVANSHPRRLHRRYARP